VQDVSQFADRLPQRIAVLRGSFECNISGIDLSLCLGFTCCPIGRASSAMLSEIFLLAFRHAFTFLVRLLQSATGSFFFCYQGTHRTPGDCVLTMPKIFDLRNAKSILRQGAQSFRLIAYNLNHVDFQTFFSRLNSLRPRLRIAPLGHTLAQAGSEQWLQAIER
jgi:hypothetical protein